MHTSEIRIRCASCESLWHHICIYASYVTVSIWVCIALVQFCPCVKKFELHGYACACGYILETFHPTKVWTNYLYQYYSRTKMRPMFLTPILSLNTRFRHDISLRRPTLEQNKQILDNAMSALDRKFEISEHCRSYALLLMHSCIHESHIFWLHTNSNHCSDAINFWQ